MNARLFASPAIGLQPALFYDITIPLDPFDSGLDYEEQPVHTAFSLLFLQLPVRDWRQFDRQTFELSPGAADASIYLGAAHNRVEINTIAFARLDDCHFRVDCELFCDFKSEGVADNVTVALSATVEFTGIEVDRGVMISEPIDTEMLRGIRDQGSGIRDQGPGIAIAQKSPCEVESGGNHEANQAPVPLPQTAQTYQQGDFCAIARD